MFVPHAISAWRTSLAEFTEETRNLVWAAAHTVPAVELRCHIMPFPAAGTAGSELDALLTSPAVLGEFFRRRAMNRQGKNETDSTGRAVHEAYIRSLTPGELADIVWRQLFIDHPPLSEPVRIVLTTLGMYGLDVSLGDLRLLREQYELVPAEEKVSKALALANLSLVLYPVESMDVEAYLRNPAPPPRFKPVLYLSELLGDWKESARQLRLRGFGLKARVDEFSPLELRRHLSAEISRLKPVALGADWPAGHRPDDAGIGLLVREAVLPLCREHGLAFLIASGDADIGALAPLWLEHPENRFLLFPGRVDQLQPAVFAAAGSRNLLLCGPDRPLSFPSTLEPFLGQRLEMLGSAFHACHSEAFTAMELAGGWAHMRWNVGKALIRHYIDLWRTGWRYSEADIQKDIAAMLSGNALVFLGL